MSVYPTETIFDTYFGKIVFYESHVKKTPMIVQVYRRKKNVFSVAISIT